LKGGFRRRRGLDSRYFGGNGGGGGGEFGAVTVGFAVDDLLFGGAVGALDDDAGFWFADESETEPVLITQRARPT
jgi:hypothetical protein